MSISLNDDEILITFDELKQLDKADISLCVDKCGALSICEKSSAAPTEIYNLWVQKLFKAYDLHEFSHKDWQKILEYLNKILVEFVKNLNSTSTNCHDKQVEQWWLDTQELLKWLETVVDKLEVFVLGLMLTFVLDVIIKTSKFANKSNFNMLCNIQQLIIHLINNFFIKMPINEATEMENLNKVLSSLCDVGILISSADVKITIETWRTVAKLGDKQHNCSQTKIKHVNSATTNEKCWQEKAMLGIFKELYEILNYYKKSSKPGNSNLLQVALFYLKILKLIIKMSQHNLTTFPAAKEFMQVFTISQHELSPNEDSTTDMCITKTLIEIFQLICNDKNMIEQIKQHLKFDKDNFKSCDLILTYLKFKTENLCKFGLNDSVDVQEFINIFNLIFEDPLLFIDCDKYPKILEYFVVLTILDTSYELHKVLCEYVLDVVWIKSYASMEILDMFYGYTLNKLDSETSLKIFEYWLQIWNKLNQTDESYEQQKKLTELLLKTIVNNINNDKLLQDNKYENMQLISLKSGRENVQNIQYFQTNLKNFLKKLQEREMNRSGYRELLNLMDVCNVKPQLINTHLKENLFTTFCSIFALTTNEFLKFQEFLNKCLIYFILQQDNELNHKILNHLQKNEQNCRKTTSIFLIKFLLKLKPHSNNLIQNLKTCNQENETLINLYDFLNSAKQLASLDMKIFKELHKTPQPTRNLTRDFPQCAKKPRIDEGNFYNIKYILNDLHLNSQKLLNFQSQAFDSKDYELLQTIKKNIEKCLSK